MISPSTSDSRTLSIQKRAPFYYKWMHHFFSDPTAHNQATLSLQQRALWVGIALLLQSLNEINHDWYFLFIAPFGSIIPLALILGSFFALWMALRPAITSGEKSRQQTSPKSTTPTIHLWQRLALLAILIVAMIGTVEFGRAIFMSFGEPELSNDGTSLDTNAAILLLEGRNPYTDSNLPDLLREFNIQPAWTTPLRQGQFANRLDYPSNAEIQSVLNTSLKANDNVPEFEAKVSYPALSFLTLIPFALFQNYNVLPLYLLSYLLLIFLAWKWVQPEIRPWILLLGLANIPMWVSVSGGNLDIFYTLLLVVAWLKRDRRWTSAIFFGLALASKQIAWYFIPFYLIMCLQHYGWKDALYRMLTAGGLALLINLPFILWNPSAWFAGVMAPVHDPMFPMGVGIVDLSITHLIPYLPQSVYSALEGIAMLSTIVWYWRICRKRPEAVFLCATIPLFFAWRSLSSYFYCVAFPIYVVATVRARPATQGVFAFLHVHKPMLDQHLTTPLHI